MPIFAKKVITAAQTLIARLRQHPPRGQALVEYSVVLSMIGILAIVALQLLQPAVSNALNNVANRMQVVAGHCAGPGNGNVYGNGGNGNGHGNGCGSGHGGGRW